MSKLYPGDLVVLALGDCYAPSQFHASANLETGQMAQLIAGGGLLGRVDAAHVLINKVPVGRPIELLTDAHG